MSKKKIKSFLNFIFIFFLAFIFFRGRLGSDDLQAFDAAYNFVNNNLNFANITIQDQWQWSHRSIWIIQNIIIIYFFKILNFFLNFDLMYFSKYFSGWIISFYSIFSIYLCFTYFKKKSINSNISLVICFGIFFGSSFSSYLTGSYIESLVIFLILLRFNINNQYYKLIIDCLITLIKSYYFLIILPLIILEKNHLKNKIYYFFSLLILFGFFKIFTFVGSVNFVQTLPFNFNLKFIIINLIDIIFSPGFGVIFTSTIPFLLILVGFQKSTLVKLFFILLFIIFISSLPFWHGQAPGGRYLISTLFIFLPEFVKAITILKKNKFLPKFLTVVVLLTIFHLPALEFRNTNIVNFENSVVSKKVVSEPASDKDLNSFPHHDLLFHNAIFANLILYHKIFDNNKSVFFKNRSFQIRDAYPMTGLQRLIFIKKNKYEYFSKIELNYLFQYILLLELLYYFLLITFLIFFVRAFLKVVLFK
jgi:hypothetical protein